MLLSSTGGGVGVKFEKQYMKTQGNEFEKQSIRELNPQVHEGTQRGLSHDDEAKGSASKLPRTGDTQGVSVCFLSSSNPEGYYTFVEEAGGWISHEERRRTRTRRSAPRRSSRRRAKGEEQAQGGQEQEEKAQGELEKEERSTRRTGSS